MMRVTTQRDGVRYRVPWPRTKH